MLEHFRGADLRVLMGYRYPGNESRAAVELYPVSGKKAARAAEAAGWSASSTPALLVEGGNKAGLGLAMTKSLADAGVNLAFLVGQVTGRKYSIVFGFDTGDDAKKAGPLIRKAAAASKK
ncbi:MAG: hypothetical protein HYU27_04190 [Acidobacteria bacterium]|nr:hypothetical protein [Acidobacteriota bacterium]